MNTQVPRVLIVGLDPERFHGRWDSDPIANGIQASLTQFAEHGVGVETCLFDVDLDTDSQEALVRNALSARPWECVIVGAGVRVPEDHLDLFEKVINLVHRYAPGAAIAFNTLPSSSFDAAARWIDIP